MVSLRLVFFMTLAMGIAAVMRSLPTKAASPPPLTDGMRLLPADSADSFALAGTEKQLGKLEPIDVTGQPFTRALRITTTSAPATEWNVQLTADTIAGVKAGDVVLAKFWLRGADSMTGEGFTTFEFEVGHPDFEKAAEMRFGAGAAWRECDVPFKATHDFPTGQARICFRCGFDRQTIEIGGVEVVNFGPSVKLEDMPRTRNTYPGREADASWRKTALARIEKIRKADLSVTVTDAKGAVIEGRTKGYAEVAW